MTYKEIKYIVENLVKKTQHRDLSLKTINNELFNLLEKNNARYKEFKNDISIRWDNFQKRNQNRIIKKSFTSFFYENFHDLFGSFLQVFFNFSENSLELFSKEKISEKIIFFEYNYQLNPIEEEEFVNISDGFKIEILYGFSIITGYLYFIVRLLGMVIRNVTQENLFILLDAIIIKNEGLNKNLNFLIICKDSKDEIFESYYSMVLYYFLRQIKGIPESFFENLYKNNFEYLWEINENIIFYLLDCFDINVEIIKASDLNIESILHGGDLLISILKSVGADVYLSGPSGRNYLELNKFKKNNIII